MKFDEKRQKALEQALGPEFFRVFGEEIRRKTEKAGRDVRDTDLKLRIAFTHRPKIPCVPVGRCR